MPERSAQGIGIFVCECGGEISTRIDLDAVHRKIRDLPDIRCAVKLSHACSAGGLTDIREAISEHELDRILIAGCTPRTIAPLFHQAFDTTSFDANSIELVDIREGCAWIHPSGPEAGVAKAVDLIRMGLARAVDRSPRPHRSVEVKRAALVIGGGVAGLTAALSLADEGVPVRVVEREDELGGMLRDASSLFPDRQRASAFMAQKVEAVAGHPMIEVLRGQQVSDVSGEVGRYAITVNDSGNHAQEPSCFEVGTIIVATGARELKPVGGYRYNGKRVVTQLEFEKELLQAANGSAPLPDQVVMILCAGQRNQSVPYCSNVCCMAALKQAMEIKDFNPDASVTILFRDLYLLGNDIHEKEVIAARQQGVRFIRYGPTSRLEVGDDEVTVEDELSGETHQLGYGRIVLAVPLVPQEDAAVVADLLDLPQDRQGFFPEIRHRVRPGDLPDRGIFVCGAAHSPVDWGSAEYQGMSAAYRALAHLSKDKLIQTSHVVRVDEQFCSGCGNCLAACAFDAIAMSKRDGVLGMARVEPMLCAGCGNCVVACPTKAIHPEVDSDFQIFSQIDEALRTGSSDPQSRILVFGCQWSGSAAADIAGARQMALPDEIRPIRVGCSARFDPLHILWAFHKGAGGVFLGACPPGSCHYGEGNLHALKRVSNLRDQLDEIGFDNRRLRFEWIDPDDPHGYVKEIWDYSNLVRLLAPTSDRKP